MAGAEAPLSKLPWMVNRPTNRRERPAPEGTQQNGHNFCLHVYVSWRPSQTVGDRTLLQIWRPPTTLSIRYTASSSDRLAVLDMDSINSMCTYRGIIISAY